MEIAKIDVSRADARKVYCQTLTAGMSGVEVTFSFDDAWDGLHRIATFKAGGTAKDVLLTDDRCEIPWEVLAKPGIQLVVGVYGARADGTLVIPTVWAELGRVEQGVTPSGDISGKQTPEVWAQILGMIGNLEELDSENKETLVAAINEVAKTGGNNSDSGGNVDQSGGSGITDTARALLISILRNAVFTTDQSASITALNTELAKTSSGDNSGAGTGGGNNSGEPETTYYTVVNSLENVENSNTAESVAEGSTYIATLTGTGDHSISSVVITMGGVDITETAWDEAISGITIATVTGDIIITATGRIIRTETLEIVGVTSYPNTTTFEYTEGTSSYTLAKPGTLSGGVLSVDFDTAECSGFDMNLYIFDADGNPYLQTANNSGPANGGLYEPTLYNPGESPGGFFKAVAPFTFVLPDGCAVMACMRRGDAAATDAVLSAATFKNWVLNGGLVFTVTA